MRAATRLFTLVGIAGEDDLDAPDLDASTRPAHERNGSAPPGTNGGLTSGQRRMQVLHPQCADEALSGRPLPQSCHPISPLRSGTASLPKLPVCNRATRQPLGRTGACPQRTPSPRPTRRSLKRPSQRGSRRSTRRTSQQKISLWLTTEVARQKCNKAKAAVRALSKRRYDCVTRSTALSWLDSLALCADAHRQTHITCALPSRARSDERSAMNLPFRFAGCIIASFTGMAMRQRGGRRSRLSRCQSHSDFGA